MCECIIWWVQNLYSALSRKHNIREKEKENECIQGESLGKSEEQKRDSRNCEKTHQIEGFG